MSNEEALQEKLHELIAWRVGVREMLRAHALRWETAAKEMVERNTDERDEEPILSPDEWGLVETYKGFAEELREIANAVATRIDVPAAQDPP